MGREAKDYLVNCGRVITAEELADIRETVAMCSGLSRSELALTIGEHLSWYSASGSLKLDACKKLLEKLETQGFLSLPSKQSSSGSPRKPIPLTERTVIGAPLEGMLGDLGPVQVVPVTEQDEVDLWNEYVSRSTLVTSSLLAALCVISLQVSEVCWGACSSPGRRKPCGSGISGLVGLRNNDGATSAIWLIIVGFWCFPGCG